MHVEQYRIRCNDNVESCVRTDSCARPIENLGNGSNVDFDTGIVRLGYPLITIMHSLNLHPFNHQIHKSWQREMCCDMA
jgi:hypothetical protein